ncbi:MAG: hypothetical protein L3J10_10185 [Sulfurimonas sp.]|nr:hypothetical protein [Sulfurimonas sp.]
MKQEIQVIKALSQCHHGNIVQFIGICTRPNPNSRISNQEELILITQAIIGQDLFSLLYV